MRGRWRGGRERKEVRTIAYMREDERDGRMANDEDVNECNERHATKWWNTPRSSLGDNGR
jgi:hypothetical protein